MVQEIKFKKDRWIDIAEPDRDTLEKLGKKYRFHELDIEDCLQESQRPKIDEYDKYMFIVLQFPIYNKKSHRFDTGQLNIFIAQNYLITIHDGTLPPLKTLFDACKNSLKARREHFDESTGHLLYEIVNALFDYMFPITHKIEGNLKKIEQGIFEFSRPKDQLFDIMVIKKNIITLRKIVLPHRSVVAALEHKQKRFLPDDLTIYFDDVVDKIEKLWSILETQKEVIDTLEDTNESILSHNINSTMRTLTVFSAIMLPLTFVTGLFGMNVRLPFLRAAESGNPFWGIILIMAFLVALMFGIFKWKKWL